MGNEQHPQLERIAQMLRERRKNKPLRRPPFVLDERTERLDRFFDKNRKTDEDRFE